MAIPLDHGKKKSKLKIETNCVQNDSRVFRYELSPVCEVCSIDMGRTKPKWIVTALNLLQWQMKSGNFGKSDVFTFMMARMYGKSFSSWTVGKRPRPTTRSSSA
jgi:hypothetical protein